MKNQHAYPLSDLNFKTEGQGKPLVLLHGWGGNLDSWFPVRQTLKNDFKVVSLDLPGFGRSPLPRTVWGVQEYADFIKNFLDDLKTDKPTVIGHSFGGQIALRFARDFPELTGKLILVDSAGIRRKSPKTLAYQTAAKTGKLIFSIPGLKRFESKAKSKLYNRIGEHDYEQSGTLKETFKKVIDQDMRPILKDVGCPTLIVWGENDKDTPINDAKLMNLTIPNSRLSILTGTGHFSYLEKPEEFCTLVKDFVDE